ncbi:MAG: cephalosporin hydroxylase family protein [Acidobacteriia bacterium]|nr:cephalosporin hydroxylase family protein [Terriglobia bacterium]
MEEKNSQRRSGASPRTVLAVGFIYLAVGLLFGDIWGGAQHSLSVFDAFHQWYFYAAGTTWLNTRWLGVPTEKCPLDMWVYQEIIYETKPDVIIDSGTYKGGSALFFASMCDLLNRGRVLSIDIYAYPDRPEHKRITYLLGSSTSDEVLAKVKDAIRPGDKVMVCLDSDHHKAHVHNELRLYSSIVTVGNYLVVEDTDINGHPVYSRSGPGPMEAVLEFLKTNSNYVQDRSREKFGVTLFPGGWLKRVR